MMGKIKAKLASFGRWIVYLVKNIPHLPRAIWIGLTELASFTVFVLLIFVYLFRSTILFFGKVKIIHKIFTPIFRPLDNLYLKIVRKFQIHDHDSINSLDIIVLASSHLMVKKSRTIIAIGGMAIGFGAVVFLLSIGYGAEKLVVSKVARLDELKQADVTVGKAASLSITDQTLVEFKDLPNVQLVLPMISAVSKVSYNNSVSDVVAYAVSSEFLKQSAIRPVKGKIFDSPMPALSELMKFYSASPSGKVAGAEVVYLDKEKLTNSVCDARFDINPLIWKPVYQATATTSAIIGYTKRASGDQTGEMLWGQSYPDDPAGEMGRDKSGQHYGQWIKSDFLLWDKKDCDVENPDCTDGRFQLQKENNIQVSADGCVTLTDVNAQCFKIVNTNVAIEGQKVAEAEVKTDKFVSIFSSYNSDEIKNANAYTTISEFTPTEVIWGRFYPSKNDWGWAGRNENNQPVGLWVKGKFKLWQKLDCTDCQDKYLMKLDETDSQQQTIEGYLRLADLQVKDESVLPNKEAGKVLGVSTTEDASASSPTTDAEETTTVTGNVAEETASDSATLGNTSETEDEIADVVEAEVGWVEIASVSAGTKEDKLPPLELPKDAKRQAVVNKAMIKLLGLSESEAIGKTFNVKFVLNEDLFSKQGHQRETESVEYTIIGVIPGDKTPAFYLPFNDLKGVGITSYPQVKIVVDNKKALADARAKIEGLGFKTSSVVDTVDRINSLFGNIRLVLSLLGMIALGVAALGMFNTLTVSLLERTREVGLMKAMGMSAFEVKRLFLTESVIMGIVGGIFGLLFGFLLGKLTSVLISIISVSKGLGFLNVTYIPLTLVLVILVLSFMIGVFTGFFPARRATKISALDALRYE